MSDDQLQPLISVSSKQFLDQRSKYRAPEPPQTIPRLNEEDPIEEDDNDGKEEEEGNQQTEPIVSETRMNPNPRIQRYLVAIEYIGTRFAGAQQQSKCRTVVGVLEEAFHKFIGQHVSIFCSSRTDAGVHAISNVCHVDVERISKRKPGETLPPHEPTVVKKAVNHFLQKNEGDIMVTDVRCIPSDFHARYKAQERTYFYRILTGPEPLSSFEKDRAWHVAEELDLLSMQKACQVLIGRHDFSSFRAAACQAKSPIRTLEELNVTEFGSSLYFPSILEREQSNFSAEGSSARSLEAESEASHVSAIGKLDGSNLEPSQMFGMRKQHRCFVVTARSRSFLYHQVRLLVGVLKSVGTGDLTVDDVENAF